MIIKYLNLNNTKVCKGNVINCQSCQRGVNGGYLSLLKWLITFINFVCLQNKKLGGFSLSKNHITPHQLINVHFYEKKIYWVQNSWISTNDWQRFSVDSTLQNRVHWLICFCPQNPLTSFLIIYLYKNLFYNKNILYFNKS